ncbi:MAG: hypothetical protein ACRCSQ_05590 [Bacteroidales bacterium]
MMRKNILFNTLLLILALSVQSCSELSKSDYDTTPGILPTGLHALELVGMEAPNVTLRSGLSEQENDLTIYEYGVVISNYPTPQLSDTTISLRSTSEDVSSFEVVFQGMKSEQTYYARSYALNANGAAYGEELTFTAPYISPLLELSGTYLVNETRVNSGPVNPYDITVKFLEEYDPDEDMTFEYLEVTGLASGPNNWNSKATTFKIIPLEYNGDVMKFMIPFCYLDIKLDKTYPAALVNYKWAMVEEEDMNIYGEVNLKYQRFTLDKPYAFLKVEGDVIMPTYYYAAEYSAWQKK